MKKEKIEFEDVKLNDNELRVANYMFDDHKLQVLTSKNKLELYQYQIDNNIPKSISRNLIHSMKQDLKKCSEDLELLKDNGCEFTKDLSDEIKLDKKIITESTMKACKQKIKEEELKIELNLPSRELNQQIGEIIDELKRLEGNLKIYKNMVRNKVRKVVKQRVQLSESKK